MIILIYKGSPVIWKPFKPLLVGMANSQFSIVVIGYRICNKFPMDSGTLEIAM